MTAPADSALDVVRAYCGWHVTPVQSRTVTVDGPGGRDLFLPTMRLVSLQQVVEDGVNLDLDMLEWSDIGRIRKKRDIKYLSGHPHVWCPWHWTDQLSGVEVTMTDGFDQAPVLDLVVDMTSRWLASADNREPGMITRRVNEVTYQWDPAWSKTPPGQDLLGAFKLRGAP